MKRSLLYMALMGALSGCAGLDVAWELHATYLTKDLMDKRAAMNAEQRQADADRAAAALIAARNEAVVK